MAGVQMSQSITEGICISFTIVRRYFCLFSLVYLLMLFFFWGQVGTIKKYPHVMKLVFLYTFFGTIQSAIFALVMEKDLNAWKLELNMELLVIVLTVNLIKCTNL